MSNMTLNKGRYKHIVLVGLNFQRSRHEGDKNFWIELLPYLAMRLKRITVFSVRNEAVSTDSYRFGDCYIEIRYISSKILRIGENGRKRLHLSKKRFPGFLGVLEKLLNTKELCFELERIYKKEQYDCIHLMDNMGFANRIIAGNVPVKVSVSAMAYQDRNRLIYDKYLLLSYKHPNLTVVPYSRTYSQKLETLGVPKTGIKHIRWGVKVNTAERNEEAKVQSKIKLCLSTDRPLFLWAGYIQQIGPRDFMLAYNCAKEALEKGLGAIFYFAFKSKKILQEFLYLHNPARGIIIRHTTVEEFSFLKKATNIFYSPVCNNKVILAPPLTWIEVMNQGVPILTTNTKGAGEIVEDFKNGFIAKDKPDIVKKIFEIAQSYKKMRENCCQKIKEKYDIRDSAKHYLQLFGGNEDGV